MKKLSASLAIIILAATIGRAQFKGAGTQESPVKLSSDTVWKTVHIPESSVDDDLVKILSSRHYPKRFFESDTINQDKIIVGYYLWGPDNYRESGGGLIDSIFVVKSKNDTIAFIIKQNPYKKRKIIK